jgi:hypothetical protein
MCSLERAYAFPRVRFCRRYFVAAFQATGRGDQRPSHLFRSERNFALREMSIFERLRKRKKINTSDDQKPLQTLKPSNA